MNAIMMEQHADLAMATLRKGEPAAAAQTLAAVARELPVTSPDFFELARISNQIVPCGLLQDAEAALLRWRWQRATTVIA